MAFQQPTRPLPQRIARAESADRELAGLLPQSPLGPTESQTWVLFTPGTDAGTATSYLDSVQDDQITPGRSRISDLGSLGHSAAPSQALADSVAEEDAELDSLDSHLSEFRTLPTPYHQTEVPHAEPVFPRHDGLGSFRFEALGTSAEAQERLYSFERFNPRRVTREDEVFDLDPLELEAEEAQELERNRRIETWRLEQSQLLLADIHKETRRRHSETSIRKLQQDSGSMGQEAVAKSAADEEAADINLAGTDWHDQDGPAPSDAGGGLLSRLARKVICDLMGIDHKLLAILFGEALPDDGTAKASATGVPPPAFESASSDDSAWQLHMLERIAKELGTFVHQISSHPGAFSTYSRMQHTALPYAGLPAIPETPADVGETAQRLDDSVPFMPQFKPTVGQPAGVPGARQSGSPTRSAPSSTNVTPSDAGQTFTQQEWEQDLDIRLVFRYLRSRFTSSRPSPPPFSSGTAHLATSSTQDAAAKAARVRQHHPLVSHAHAHTHAHGYHRSRPAERRTFKATVPSSPAAIRHAPGSCASQSTRRSARRSSISSRPSSRHYWDIGGSIGTGSVIASTGPLGSWGEV
ncbi:hypothetical protein BT67DRAFT_438242 [Trichocladium antarcticum]|uniref:Uncharacterized protein n=1 Tax=Trichocladium antarcticum TaxID=1450529 RepID=A0AAN6UUN8_9PEZI|nr:hypothetical protein BT67DRAFT_438242 [Trichocladium antarcticum]